MIEDLKEFEKLLKLCRKQGVSTISIGAVSVKFGDLPKKSGEPEEAEDVQTDEPTVEEIMNWSIPRENN